jgi:hypothetical protein
MIAPSWISTIGDGLGISGNAAAPAALGTRLATPTEMKDPGKRGIGILDSGILCKVADKGEMDSRMLFRAESADLTVAVTVAATPRCSDDHRDGSPSYLPGRCGAGLPVCWSPQYFTATRSAGRCNICFRPPTVTAIFAS